MKPLSATFGTALLLGALVATAPDARAATPTPAMGTNYWDCVISGGAQKGIAFLTFLPDGTFSGYQLLSATPATSSTRSLDGRTPYGDVGRGTNGTAPNITNMFGFGPISGPWGYDYKYRIIGNYSIPIRQGTNVQLRPISFTGRTTQGRSLTLVAYTPTGKITYSGRPYKPMTDLTGNWYANKVANGQSFIEFFPLASEYTAPEGFEDILGYPGIYRTGSTTNTYTDPDSETNVVTVIKGMGTGPTYTTMGWTVLSSQKKIGFSFTSVPSDYDSKGTNMVLTLSSTYGNFSKLRYGFQAPTKGIQDPADKVTFNAYLQTNLVPVAPLGQ